MLNVGGVKHEVMWGMLLQVTVITITITITIIPTVITITTTATTIPCACGAQIRSGEVAGRLQKLRPSVYESFNAFAEHFGRRRNQIFAWYLKVHEL